MDASGSILSMSFSRFLFLFSIYLTYHSDEAPKANSTTNKQSYPINTFIVPDNDDDSDVIEVDDSVPTKPMSPNESEGSDQSYDPDNCDFRENSTPITPPSNKEVSLGAEPKPTETPLKTSSEGRSDTFNGTSGSPIVLDGDDAPVTPRITPPPAPNAPDDHTTSVDVGADAMDYDSDHSSVASSPREPQSATEFNYWDEEDVISYEFGSENESGSSDDGSSDSEMDSQSDNASSHYDNMEEDKHLSQADNGSSVVNEKELGFGAAPTIQPQNTEEAQKDLNKVLRLDPLSPAPLYSPYAIPNSSLQQTDNSYAPRLPSLHALSTSGWEPQAVPASDKFSVGITPETFGHRFSARSLNRQQPPAYTSAPMMPPAPVVLSSYNGSNGVSPVKNDIYNAEGQWQVEKPGFSGQPVQRTGSVDYFQAEREPNTRVCISDIVDTRSQEARPAQEIPQKRKANEMESATMPARAPAYPDTLARRSSVHPYASGANTVPLGASQRVDDTDMDVFSQDAQPRPSMPDLDDSTQNTGIYSIDESKPVPVPEEERHSKRVKTSDGRRARGFVTHAATALAGAVVGGLGTIALLASLPPEYFA